MKRLWTILFALCMSCGNFRYVQEPVPTSSIIQEVTLSPQDSIDADGESTATVKVILPENTDIGKGTINFITSAGIFLESGKPTLTVVADRIESNGHIQWIGYATLQSSIKRETAEISIRIADRVTKKNLNFSRAYADHLVITPDKLGLKRNLDNEINFTVELFKSVGNVSVNTPVHIEIVDPVNKTSRGTFRSKKNLTDSAGKTTFIYSIGTDTAYIGPLRVRAWTDKKSTSQNDTVNTIKNAIIVYTLK